MDTELLIACQEAVELPQTQIRDKIAELLRDHNLNIAGLTNQQFAEAIRQALPDFKLYVVTGPSGQHGQQVIYIPGREACKWKSRYEKTRETLDEVIELTDTVDKFARNGHWGGCLCDHGHDGRMQLQGPKCGRCVAKDRLKEIKEQLSK